MLDEEYKKTGCLQAFATLQLRARHRPCTILQGIIFNGPVHSLLVFT